VFEVVDGLGCHAAKELDGVLVAQVVRALDGVVHVPEPVVLAHVAQRSADATLGRDGMRTRGEHLRQHGDFQAGFGQLQGRAHAGTAGTHDDRIELAGGNGHH